MFLRQVAQPVLQALEWRADGHREKSRREWIPLVHPLVRVERFPSPAAAQVAVSAPPPEEQPGVGEEARRVLLHRREHRVPVQAAEGLPQVQGHKSGLRSAACRDLRGVAENLGPPRRPDPELARAHSLGQ